MNIVTVSPKFQVVIPRHIRQMMDVKPGQRMKVIAYDNQVTFVPVRPLSEARGVLKGMDSYVQREEADEER